MYLWKGGLCRSIRKFWQSESRSQTLLRGPTNEALSKPSNLFSTQFSFHLVPFLPTPSTASICHTHEYNGGLETVHKHQHENHFIEHNCELTQPNLTYAYMTHIDWWFGAGLLTFMPCHVTSWRLSFDLDVNYSKNDYPELE